MKQKHTAGPWNWDEEDGRIYITPLGRPCHYVADINSKENDPEGDYPRRAQRLANAALIASAPDMLDMLYENLLTWEGEEDSVRREHRQLISRLKATIKKAETGHD